MIAFGVLAANAHADTVRAAVGRPVERAEALITAQKYTEALVQLQHASAVGALTPHERAVIAQLRGTAEAGAGNYAQAAVAYQTVLAAEPQPLTAQLQYTQAIAGFYYSAADYPDAITWVNRYIAAGGTDATTRALLPQAYAQQDDYAQAEHALQREPAPLPPAELQLLAFSAQKAGDQAGYLAALQSLLITAPSPQIWNAAIAQVTAAPDFPDALVLDVERLRLATQTLNAAADYEDYAERAILAGQAQEAKFVIDAGFSSGILTNATDGGHAARLKALADGNAPPAPSTAPDALQPGIAAYQAGNYNAASSDFNQIANNGSGAAAQLARLWAIRAQNAVKTQ